MPDFVYLLETRLSAAQRSAVQHIRDAAREAGMNVFLAGGAVRDLMSGFPVRDLDFSVQGGTSKLKRPLEKAGAEVWGSHAETHTLHFWFPGSVRVEISSTRREEYPTPGKPVYHMATMLEDLRRRDFTANAMAISLNEGSYGLLLDPMNGIADIENRTLRLVSSYGFIEDPSRLVRAARLSARTGWDMDDRTRQRYENAREDAVIQYLSPYLRGYELEEIAHEEDALKALKALETEGWMQHLHPGWSSASADLAGYEALHQVYVKFLMQGVHPDVSAAQMRLLTAKMAPKDLGSLKKALPCPGFVEQWEHLDDAAKEFAARLTSRETALPSDTWKLIANYQPEPVLWLAFTSKSSAVQARFNDFFNVWPEARQKIPTQLMSEMRITADLPEYGHLLDELFFALIDGKLETEEAMRAFLNPYSPPAPPPPVKVGRSRARKTERRGRLLQDEQKKGRKAGAAGQKPAEEPAKEEEKAAAKPEKPAKAEKAPARAAQKEKKVAAKPEKAVKPAKKAEKKAAAAKPAAKKAAARPAPKKAAAKAVKPTRPAKAAKPARAKAVAKKAARPAAKKVVAKPVTKKAPKPVAKKAAKKAAAKPAARKAAPAKAAKKVPARVAKKVPAKAAKKAPAKPAARKAAAKPKAKKAPAKKRR